MKKLLLLLLLWSVCPLAGITQNTYWQQELHYQIDVTLNDTANSLDGFLKLQYINHSPDTLTYIWFHLWPNAYKNDQTAFSDQLLENGRTDFYFSNTEQRGYINRLDFRMNGMPLTMEDHPQYIDIVKVLLPAPLLPGATAEINTPFHVKLPYLFSRGGHVDQFYSITQWYPKPAVYDRAGWHPIPYLDQGEFYSDLGSFDVQITLPQNYVVAATGHLQEAAEWAWLQERARKGYVAPKVDKPANPHPKWGEKPKPRPKPVETEPVPLKTLHYVQDKVHDFAWFADKDFIVELDTLQLPSGRVIQAGSFYRPQARELWSQSMPLIKAAVRFRSQAIGEYPFDMVNVVEGPGSIAGGMEYPTITLLSGLDDLKSLDLTIEHEIGHNWFYGILATNERDYPWMDEGINTYYDNRYMRQRYGSVSLMDSRGAFQHKLPEDEDGLLLRTLYSLKADQPIQTGAGDFTELNYGLVAYSKTGTWMEYLERRLGRGPMDEAMQTYYRQWQFKHPYPADLQQVMEQQTGKDLKDVFALLDTTGRLEPAPVHKKIKPTFLFNYHNTDSVHYINLMPAIGYNLYDGFMIGGLIHNFNLPVNRFQFMAAPLYATGSHQLVGLAGMNYTWYTGGRFSKIRLGISGGRFSTQDGVDSLGTDVYEGFYRLAPSLRLSFRNSSPRSTRDNWIEWKSFFIGERNFTYRYSSTQGGYFPEEAAKYETRYINQLTLQLADNRVLYPYDIQLQVQQGSEFYRASVTGHYFFNYAQSGGMQLRLFAAKFGYLGGANALSLSTYRYQPKLTAVRGDEDYTYSNYFIGRNETDGLAGQQIMMRDGGLKLRTDLFQGLQGRSDNWVASLNFNTTLPPGLFPPGFPLRLFLDVGTYAEAWDKEAGTSRFLYVSGLQLSLFKNLLNIYAPVLYSKEFKNSLKTVPEENKFLKKISFSIDIQRFNIKRLFNGKIPL